ncbi:MAG: hypothetical protein PHI18_04815, partial [bacterium]|nr:hypothetical protein [bacterium]
MPPECETGPARTHNFNSFAMNGTASLGRPGYFDCEADFTAVLAMPIPARYYLRICLESVYWVSEVFQPVPEHQTIEIDEWTCYPCGCNSILPAPANVAASIDQFCSHVQITWANIAGEQGYVILRDGNSIGTANADATIFYDVTAIPGTTHSYAVRGFNVCGNGHASLPAPGRRKAVPGPPQNVQASDGVYCFVRISWSAMTADSFQIRRDGVRVGRTLSGGTSFDDMTTVGSTVYNYSAIAYNNCGPSPESVANSGYGGARPSQVTSLTASDTSCAAIYLRWADTVAEDSFRVIRDGDYIDYAARDVTQYADFLV